MNRWGRSVQNGQTPNRAAKRLRRTSACALVASLALGIGGAGISSASVKPKVEQHTILVGYAATNILLTPFWVGIQQGIFAKYGLTVKLVGLGSSTVTATAIQSNSITVGTATPIGLIPGYALGAPLQAISEYNNGLTAAIVVRNGYAAAHGISKTSTPQQIATALVGSTEVAGGVPIVGQANVIMKSLGLQESQYTTALVSNSAADVTLMASGKADWYLASYPTPYLSVQNGSGFIAINQKNAPIFLTKQLNNIVVANKIYAAAHPAFMKLIVKAISQAVTYVDHHEKQSLPLVATYLPGYTLGQLSQSIALVQWAKAPQMNENIWRSSVAFNIKSGQLKPPVVVQENGIWTNAYT